MDNETNADPYRARAGRQWWLVFALTLAAIIAVIDRSILSLLFEPVKNDLNFTDTQMAVVFGFAFAIANVLFTLPAGYLADRVSRRGMIALGTVVWSVMTCACGLAASFWQLLSTRAGVGFAEGVLHPTAFSMLRSALTPERRGRGFAVYGSALIVGSALGFTVGGLLIAIMAGSGITELPVIGEVKPWRLVLLALGVIGLPFALLMATVREPAREQGAQLQGTMREALAHMFRHWKIYLPLMIYCATLSMQANAYGAFVAAVPMRRWGLPVSQVGHLLGILMLCASPVGMWITGMLMDRAVRARGAQGLTIIGIFVGIVVMAASTLAPMMATAAQFFTLAALVFFVAGSYFAITGNVLSMVTPAQNMGKTTAVVMFVYGIVGMGSGPAIVGAISDRFFPGKSGIGYALGLSSGVFTLISLLAVIVLFFTIRGAATPPAPGGLQSVPSTSPAKG